MKRIFTRVAVTAFALPLAAAIVASGWIGHKNGHRVAANTHRLSPAQRARLASLTVPFVANTGRLGRDVAFMAPTFAGTAFVTRDGSLVLSLPASRGHHRQGWTLVETPLGGHVASVRGVRPMPARVNIFQGNRSRDWYRGLRTFARVNLGAVWSGIDYSVRAHGDNVERLFTVRPGADVASIRMRVKGVKRLGVHDDRLVAVTGNGPVTLSRPRAWQRIDGQRRVVPVSYTVSGDHYGFHLGRYDHNRPVVIDPVIRSTYVGGGSGNSTANDMRVLAANGNIYLAGSTTSPAFPGTTGGAQPASGGSKDAFVAELSPDLSQLIQATYLGGSSDDSAISLAVAPASTSMAGDVYVVGTTRSADFPVTSGSAQTTCGGGSTACQNSGDAFVSALSPDLKTLVASSYLGGSGIDEGHAVSIAPFGSPDAGQVYVAGRTLSPSFPFVSSTSAQPAPASASNYQAFVARFSANLGTANATYLGGNGTNEAYAITVAPSSGTVYVAGDTSASDFPCTNASGTPAPAGGSCGTGAGAGAQATLAGGFDAYVSELNPGLTKILQSTYLGGSDVDGADALAIAPPGSGEAGQVYAGGLTYSANFPGTVNGAQPALAGSADGFITRLSPALTSLGQTTYLGGSGNDTVQTIAITASGVYAAGTTGSSDFPCTTTAGPVPAGGTGCTQQHSGAQYSYGGGSSDGFVALLNPALTGFEQASYFGGLSSDVVTGLAMAPASSTYAGDVLIGGGTLSGDLPATTGAAVPARTGSGDAFVAALTPDLQSPEVTLDLSYSASASSIQKNKTVTTTITVTNNSASSVGTANKVVVIDALNDSSSVGALAYSSATTSQGTCSQFSGLVDCALGNLAANGGTATITVVATGSTVGTVNGTISVSAYQALDPNSTSSLSQTTTVTKVNSSSGGGGLRWPALLLLALVSLMAYGLRRRRAGNA